MNILFLDDDPIRQRMLKSMLPSAIQVYTADEAINCLKTKQYNYIFLDHDLGGEQYVDSTNYNTGMTVANWIMENNTVVDKIFVHSFNPVGATNIVNLLSPKYRTCICPFGMNKFNDVITYINNKNSLGEQND